MAIIGVAITKAMTFRGNVQHFSNVYHYRCNSLPNATAADQVIDYLTTFEKSIHASAVTFTHGALWSAGGTRAENQMISQKLLTGTGSGTAIASFDRERAYLIQWEAGTSSRGQKVRLKKWYHTLLTFPGSTALTDPILGNTAALSTGDKNAIALKCNDITQFSTAGGGPYTLCAKSGRDITDNTPKPHSYLEHHQLGEEWRGS